ncbi:hypothetical protein IE81DRAFT_323129 [Ceraceosorus guamensis]|uniref:Chitobiosyldiphosphodolichol beta-mannosyltransferase n=1 Tax=Ceraceosorus guamensis TaxID=1522189 RepID=A0A316VZC0_9BASI|nr:hypothetical protein IE81DRAFT_323129 [Ceraceosorus guamensis]PWN42779.1 hypothetical protein IE81DRAFT_323129 [Ceraceosorus guamensis]
MCNHVDSLANEGWRVAVVGYAGVAVPSNLRRSSIKHHHLATPPAYIARLPRLLFAFVAPFKVLWQSAVLFLELTTQVQPPPELLLVQTPPALPTLFVVRVASLLLQSRVIIDWHNLGYTILALRMGAKSPLVALARHLERLTGRNAYAHLFVTHAMRTRLAQEWALRGKKLTLYDRPPAHFRKRNPEETHRLWTTLAPTISPSCNDFWPAHSLPRTTPFTSESGPSAVEIARQETAAAALVTQRSPEAASSPESLLRDDRPALVVSSTSWTADEDFSILLKAAGIYERRARQLVAVAEANQTSASSPTLEEPIASGDAFDRARRRLSSSSHRATGSGSGSVEYASSASGSMREKSRKRASVSAEEAFGPTRLPNEPAEMLPKVLILVTGKGELRAHYEQEIARLESAEEWKWVRIRTVWLEAADYPVLLGESGGQRVGDATTNRAQKRLIGAPFEQVLRTLGCLCMHLRLV